MNFYYKAFLAIILMANAQFSLAKLNIVTTTTNINSLVEIIGGDKVSTMSFSKGAQDPHFLESRPSYMFKARAADLLVSVGLDLEIGWLPLIIRGSRNVKLLDKNSAHLELGQLVTRLGVPHEEISRKMGDIHPEGNPHILLSPRNSVIVAKAIATRLSLLDPKSEEFFTRNYIQYESTIKENLEKWKRQIGKNKSVITYHKTLSYFFADFNIKNPIVLEPIAGVPPTAKHVLKVVKELKKKNISLIMVENYFHTDSAKKIASQVKNINVKSIPVAVSGIASVNTIIELYNHLAQIIGDN